jgi:hypothetical protein
MISSTADLPTLPLMPRGVRARPTRFAPPPILGARASVARGAVAPKVSEPLRKNPAWIDRDL